MKILFFLSIILIISSCSKVRQIGQFNMISTRNITFENKAELIASYAGGSNKGLRKSRSETIDEAINTTVKKTPGGEYMMNVKVYLVNKEYYAVEGDVYGYSNANFRGFKIGDEVQWKVSGFKHQGIITELIDDKNCSVKDSENEKIMKLKYSELQKTGSVENE